jgi:hypothetical protein
MIGDDLHLQSEVQKPARWNLPALRAFWLKSPKKTGMSELHSFYIGKDVGLDVLNSGLLKYATVTMEVWNFVFQRGQKN